MSCRVIGREIEAAFLDAIAEALAKRGAKRLVGLYRPTAKNAIVRDFYPSLGFAAAGDEDGADLWEKLLVGSAAPRLRPVTVEWGTQ
jgi:predicted enzyme involved in methoxymalonyl-ACP biosynthesis